MLIVTMNDVPGYQVTRIHGEVFGLTVRARNIGSQFGAGIKSMFGGELKGMVKLMVDSRNEVMGRMIGEAQSRGANAIVAMRFDTSEMAGNWTEIVAYGTAVTVVPISEEAKAQGMQGWTPSGAASLADGGAAPTDPGAPRPGPTCQGPPQQAPQPPGQPQPWGGQPQGSAEQQWGGQPQGPAEQQWGGQ